MLSPHQFYFVLQIVQPNMLAGTYILNPEHDANVYDILYRQQLRLLKRMFLPLIVVFDDECGMAYPCPSYHSFPNALRNIHI